MLPMLFFEKATRGDILDLQDRLRSPLRQAANLESAAQLCAEAIFREFSDAVLSRVFLTAPLSRLPEQNQMSANAVAARHGIECLLTAQTPVLSLLGTYGLDASWCDRRLSSGHQNIPLCSQEFVESIPMIARLLQEMGSDLKLDRLDGEGYVEQVLGAGWVGLFYVDDARTALDAKGRHIIPARDFVAKHHVRTVFGLSKAYGSGAIATLIVFTSAIVPREQVEELVPLMSMSKAATMEMMNQGRVFA